MTELENFLVYLMGDGYLVFMSAVVGSYILLEALLPLFPHRAPLLKRWYVNLSLHLINSITVYALIYNFFGMNLEDEISQSGFGIFHWVGGVPIWLQFLAFAVVADLCSYGMHRFYHNWRPLWRLHVVHHSDLDIDITDSFRFHPFQILIEFSVRLLITLMLGVPLLVLVLFDVLYTLFVFYPHANIKLPRPIEKILRTVIVTSDMHRVHHSSIPADTNSNYGDIFSFWDRLFGSYQFKEWDEQKDMQLGLEYFREKKDQSLISVLMQPFNYQPRRQQRLSSTVQGSSDTGNL